MAAPRPGPLRRCASCHKLPSRTRRPPPVPPTSSLTALGLDLTTDGMRDTPARMARAYAELFTAPPFSATTFPNEEGYDELVLARSIPLRSVCEHHLLPFAGVAPRRLSARRAHPRAVQAGTAGRALRRATAGAGTAHPADRQLAARRGAVRSGGATCPLPPPAAPGVAPAAAEIGSSTLLLMTSFCGWNQTTPPAAANTATAKATRTMILRRVLAPATVSLPLSPAIRLPSDRDGLRLPVRCYARSRPHDALDGDVDAEGCQDACYGPGGRPPDHRLGCGLVADDVAGGPSAQKSGPGSPQFGVDPACERACWLRARQSQDPGPTARGAALTMVWGRAKASNREASWKPVMAWIASTATTSTMTP